MTSTHKQKVPVLLMVAVMLLSALAMVPGTVAATDFDDGDSSIHFDVAETDADADEFVFVADVSDVSETIEISEEDDDIVIEDTEENIDFETDDVITDDQVEVNWVNEGEESSESEDITSVTGAQSDGELVFDDAESNVDLGEVTEIRIVVEAKNNPIDIGEEFDEDDVKVTIEHTDGSSYVDEEVSVPVDEDAPITIDDSNYNSLFVALDDSNSNLDAETVDIDGTVDEFKSLPFELVEGDSSNELALPGDEATEDEFIDLDDSQDGLTIDGDENAEVVLHPTVSETEGEEGVAFSTDDGVTYLAVNDDVDTLTIDDVDFTGTTDDLAGADELDTIIDEVVDIDNTDEFTVTDSTFEGDNADDDHDRVLAINDIENDLTIGTDSAENVFENLELATDVLNIENSDADIAVENNTFDGVEVNSDLYVDIDTESDDVDDLSVDANDFEDVADDDNLILINADGIADEGDVSVSNNFVDDDSEVGTAIEIDEYDTEGEIDIEENEFDDIDVESDLIVLSGDTGDSELDVTIADNDIEIADAEGDDETFIAVGDGSNPEVNEITVDNNDIDFSADTDYDGDVIVVDLDDGDVNVDADDAEIRGAENIDDNTVVAIDTESEIDVDGFTVVDVGGNNNGKVFTVDDSDGPTSVDITDLNVTNFEGQEIINLDSTDNLDTFNVTNSLLHDVDVDESAIELSTISSAEVDVEVDDLNATDVTVNSDAVVDLSDTLGSNDDLDDIDVINSEFNDLSANADAIVIDTELEEEDYLTIDNNEFDGEYGTSDGTAVDLSDVASSNNENIAVTENEIANFTESGVGIDVDNDQDDATIEDNTFDFNAFHIDAASNFDTDDLETDNTFETLVVTDGSDEFDTALDNTEDLLGTVEQGISATASGDTVHVAEGDYVETGTLTTSGSGTDFDLVGADDVEDTVLSVDDDSDILNVDENDDFTVKGLTFSADVDNSHTDISISGADSHEVNVTENVFDGPGTQDREAIDVTGVATLGIDDNEIDSYETGISLSDSGADRVDVTDNKIENTVTGVEVTEDFDDDIEVLGNAFADPPEVTEDVVAVKVDNSLSNDFIVRFNDFDGLTEDDQFALGGPYLADELDNNDANANWYGTEFGPNAEDGSNVDLDDEPAEVRIYEPFLTSEDELDTGDTGEVTQFGYAVTVDNTLRTFAIPSLSQNTIEDLQDDAEDGSIYTWDEENQVFTHADPDERPDGDAYVVELEDDEELTVLAEFASEEDDGAVPTPSTPVTTDLSSGVNYLPAAFTDSSNQLDDSSEVSNVFGASSDDTGVTEGTLANSWSQSTFDTFAGPNLQNVDDENVDADVSPFRGYVLELSGDVETNQLRNVAPAGDLDTVDDELDGELS